MRDISNGYRRCRASYRIRDSFEQQKIRSGRKITIPVSSFGILSPSLSLSLSLSFSLSSSKVHGISVGCLTGRTGRVGSGILIRFRNPFRKERERGSEWGAEWGLKVGRAPTGNFSRKSIESRRSLANVPVKKITLASRSRLSLSPLALSLSLSLALARSLARSLPPLFSTRRVRARPATGRERQRIPNIVRGSLKRPRLPRPRSLPLSFLMQTSQQVSVFCRAI